MQFKALLIVLAMVLALATAEVAGSLTMTRSDAFSKVFSGNSALVTFTLTYPDAVDTMGMTHYHNVHFVNYDTPYLVMEDAGPKKISCFFTDAATDAMDGFIVTDPADAGKYSYTMYHTFDTTKIKTEADNTFSYTFSCHLPFADGISAAPNPTQDWSCVMPPGTEHTGHLILVSSFVAVPIEAISYSAASIAAAPAVAPAFAGNTMGGMSKSYIDTTSALTFTFETEGLENDAVLEYKANLLYTAEADFGCTYGADSTPLTARLEGDSAETCTFTFELKDVVFSKVATKGSVVITCKGFTSPKTKVAVAPVPSAQISTMALGTATCTDCIYKINRIDVQLGVSTVGPDTTAWLSMTARANTLQPTDDYIPDKEYWFNVHFIDYVDNAYIQSVEACYYDDGSNSGSTVVTHSLVVVDNEQTLSVPFKPEMFDANSKSFTVVCKVMLKAAKIADGKTNWSCIMPSGGMHSEHTYMSTDVAQPTVTVDGAKKGFSFTFDIENLDVVVPEEAISAIFARTETLVESMGADMVSTKSKAYIKSNLMTLTGLKHSHKITIVVVPENAADLPQLAYILSNINILNSIRDTAILPNVEGATKTAKAVDVGIVTVADECLVGSCGKDCFACAEGNACTIEEDCVYYCSAGKCTGSGNSAAFASASLAAVVVVLALFF